jgi:hypothetical protein
MLYGWQAVLCALAASGVTQAVKTVIDIIYEKRWDALDEERREKLRARVKHGPSSSESVAKVVRKQSIIVTRLVLPITPIVVGFVYANLVPLLPETLVEYVSDNDVSGFWLVMAKGAWGGACGQFANYLYDRAKKTLETWRSKPLTTD